MFARKVLFEHVGLEGYGPGVEGEGVEGHAGDCFEDRGVFEGLLNGDPPGKGRVARREHGGTVQGRAITKRFNDDPARAFFVRVHFIGRELAGDGDRAMEIIGMGRAEAGNGPAGLCPRYGVVRMGMDDAADVWEGAVEGDVGGKIDRWAQAGAEGEAMRNR